MNKVLADLESSFSKIWTKALHEITSAMQEADESGNVTSNHFHVSAFTEGQAVAGVKLAQQVAADLVSNKTTQQEIKARSANNWLLDIADQSWASADVDQLAERLAELHRSSAVILCEYFCSGLDPDRERFALSTLEAFGRLKTIPAGFTDGCCKTCSKIELVFKAPVKPQVEGPGQVTEDWQELSPDEFVIRSHKSGKWQAQLKLCDTSTLVAAHNLEDLFTGIGRVFTEQFENLTPPS